MINASPINSSNPSEINGSPMPTPPEPQKSTDLPNISESASTSTAPNMNSVVTPPKVLPSHQVSHTPAARPLNAPHQDIASLHKTLADKVNTGSADATSSGLPPTPPPNQQPTTATTVTPPSKKSGIGMKTLIAILVFVLTVAGAGAAYYLNFQQQDIRQQAFLPDWEGDNSGQTRQLCYGGGDANIQDGKGLDILVRENPVCERISSPNKNSIGEYSATYTLTNTSDYDLEVTYSEHSNYCPTLPYGENATDPNKVPGCYTETLNRTQSVLLGTASESKSKTITIAGQGSECGSWQTDLNIKEIKVYNKGTKEVVKTISENQNGCLKTTDVEGWTLCQTGGTCSGGGTTQASCDSISVPDTVTAGSSVTVKVAGTNVSKYGVHYASSRQDYCPANTWTSLTPVNEAAGDFTWNTAGLAPGKYYLAATAQFTTGSWCSANPSGACGTEFKECKQCGKEVTVVSPETVGSCNSITAPDTITQGDNVTIKVNGTNLVTSKMYYSPEKTNYCPVNGVNPWTEIGANVPTKGEFAWNTASLTPGTYYIAATAQLSATKWCSANPSIAQCSSGFENCTQCGKKITVIPRTTTGEAGMCVNLCGVAAGNPDIADMSRCGSTGGLFGTPKKGEYLHLKCATKGTAETVNILLTLPGSTSPVKINVNNNATAVYKVDLAGTYSVRCEVTNATSTSTSTTSTTTTTTTTNTTTSTLPGTGRITSASITEQKQECINAGGSCDIGTSCARYKTQLTSISCPNTIEGKGTICCKTTTPLQESNTESADF